MHFENAIADAIFDGFSAFFLPQLFRKFGI
jgi:hypothetical protein